MHEQTLQLFEPHVGSTFHGIVNGQPALNLELAAVEDLTVAGRQRDEAIRSQPFSLIFHGPNSPIAPQAQYDVSHAELGSLQIFLVPIGPDRKSRQMMQYQAIFN
jgi:hypothetical protein